MIENCNASKNPVEANFDIKKFIGVASINILAVNPKNATLNKYGWEVPEGAEEPKYLYTKTNEDGKVTNSVRICFLCQITDIDYKPLVMLNFFCRPDLKINRDGTKVQVIDVYGRTAWATKEEVQNKAIPQYTNGPASISTPYKMCHHGEEEIITFLMKYLNVTPFMKFDSVTRVASPNKNPGKLTIDNWAKICAGDMSEIVDYLSRQPDNKLKVVLGVKLTDNNKSYQTFLPGCFLGNGSRVDYTAGEYTNAAKKIKDFAERNGEDGYVWSAKPVTEWKLEANDVQDNSESMFEQETAAASATAEEEKDDLPF